MLHNLLFDSNSQILQEHFPGNPIIPAAMLLHELTQAFNLAHSKTVSHVKQVRFNMPTLPGQNIPIEYQAKNQSNYRFTCKHGQHIAFKGLLGFDTPTIINIDVKSNELNANQAIDAGPLYQQLPHSGSVCLIDQILDWTDTSITSHGQLKQDQMLYDETLSPWAGLEYAAQSLALHGVLLSSTNEQKNDHAFISAMIVSIKSLSINPDLNLSVPAAITTQVQILAHQPQAASCQFTVMSNEVMVCCGILNAVFLQ